MAFNGRFILNIAHYAAKQGANFDQLIAYSGHKVTQLEQSEFTVSDEHYNTVIEQAVLQTNDPFFGLHVGESQQLSAIGLILQISQSSETVRQALEYCCQFANLGCSALPLSLEEMKDCYKVKMTPNPLWMEQSPISVKHTADGVMVFSLREFYSLTRENYRPIAIHLPWSQPRDIREYQRILACPIYFKKNEIAILLQKRHVEEKVITSDHALLQVLLAHAEQKSNQLQKKKGFQAIVKQSVINLIQPSFPSIEQVAAHLNLSLRTLQRKLKVEGYTYKQLIDELRKEFAITYLKKPELSITEIAFLLNYADTSAFSRSFKRWTGQRPVEFRKQNRKT